MATKLQGKNYLPGYCSMRDVDEDATSRWSSYYHGKKLIEHACNGYVPWLVNEFSEHDKEKLKRTMLEHEVIFQNQVYELHRLYRIQKDLMNELQSRGLYGSSIVAETSQSNSFTSRKWSECTEKISQASHLYGGNTNYGKTPFGGNERLHNSSIREGSVQSDHIPLLNGTSRKDKEIDYRSRKRRKCDLQLPADAYVDIEDDDAWGQKNFNVSSSSATIPKNGTFSVCSDDDVKLTLGSNQHVSNTTAHIDVSTCRLVDLNKPAIEVGSEIPVDSAPVQLLGLNTVSKWNQSQHSSLRSITCFRDGHGDQQTTADFLHADVHKKMEYPFFNHETGKSRSTVDFLSQSSDLTKSCGTLQLNSQKCHGILFDHNHPEKWYEKETNHSIQRPVGFSYFNHSRPVLMSTSVPASFTNLQADLTSCASQFASPWRNPASTITNKPDEQLPHLSGSSNFVNKGLCFKVDARSHNACEESQNTRNLSTKIESGIAVSRTSGFYHDLHLDSDPVAGQNIHGNQPRDHLKGLLSRDLKTPISVNLNQTYSSVIEDKLSIRQDRDTNDTESKYSKLLKGPSWCNGNESFGSQRLAPRVDFSFPNGHWQHFSSSNDAGRKADKELGLCLHKLQEVASNSQQEVASNSQFRDQKEKAVSENSGKRIFGLLIHDIVKQKNMQVSVRHSESHLTRNAKFLESDNDVTIGMCSDTEVVNSQENVHVADLNSAACGGKNSARILNHINLNIEFGCSDDPTSSEILLHDDAGISSRSLPSVSTNTAAVIDLEAPVSQSEMSILNQREPIPSSKKDGAEKKNHSDDTVQLAAQNLVAISIDFHTRSNEINPDHLVSPRADTLSWFAEVVSHSAEDPDLLHTGAGGTPSSGHDGLDLFEAMTLNLKETKMDEHWPKEIKNKDEKEDKEDIGVASMLFTKPRRGLARKRRQRRDFQKDILPGLASLSRHEVTQDLQNIGGMMKASGRPWQTGLTRRNASRNGINSQARGRRQLRSLVNAIEEVQVSSLPHSQPISIDIGVCGRSMIGWGRTTRRCRRQRCGPVSLPAALT